MSDTENKSMPERQVKIYLAVLGALLIVAVLVTMFTISEDAQIAQEDESSAKEQIAQDSKPEQTKPVQNDFIDANSRIEHDEASKKPDETAIAEEPEEIADIPEEPAEVHNVAISFNPETDLMVWPVSGNVLMDYSPNALIYDATLDLYRTNNSISIGAETAEEVVAAAGGIVQEIGEADELGHYVVINNGNGYETTYGQLSGDLTVVVGDAVAQGEVIGRISAPSWYSVALGTHLTFSLRVNGEPANPLDYLENILDD